MNAQRISVLIFALAISAVSAAVADEGNDLLAQLKLTEQLYRTEGPETALPEFERLLDASVAAQNSLAEGTAQRFVGECFWLMGKFDQSRQYLESALSQGRQLDDLMLQGKTLNVLGLLEWDLGEFDAAIDNFQSASDIGARLGDLKLQGATLNNISLVYDELGDYRTSLRQYKQVLDIYSQTDFPRGEGDTLGNIGGVHYLLGQFSAAIGYYQRALAISESLESVPAMSQDHGNLGFAYAGLGQTDTALQHFDRALELAEQAGMAQEKGYWLRGKANAEIRAGRYDQGLQHHREVLEIYHASGANAPLLDALHDMGLLLLELGDPMSAQQHFEQAMELALSMQRTRSITLNQLALGDLQLRHQRPAAAQALYREALQRASKSGEADLQIESRLRLARTHFELDNYSAAQKELGTALQHEYMNDPARAVAIFMQGEILRKQGASASALDHYQQSEELTNKIGHTDLLWQIEFGRGMALEQLGQKAEAVEALSRAVTHIESVRSRLKEKRFRSGYLQDKHQVYTQLVRLQLELDREDDAFSTAEKLRSYSFQRQSVTPADQTGEQAELIAEMRGRIRQLQHAIDDERVLPVPDQRQLAIETFSTELLAAEQQYQAILDDQGRKAPKPETLLASDDARRHLLAGEALIEYVVGPDNIMMFVLTPEEMQTMTVPVKQRSLYSRIELLRDLLLEKNNERWARPATGLAAILMDPVLKGGWLDDTRQLYLIPHDVLNYLPFAALTIKSGSGEKALIEQFDLAYLPSASALALRVGQDPDIKSVLAVAPSRGRLVHAPEEASAIAALFAPNAKLLTGSAATETAFRNLAGSYQVLHLATHGYFNKLNPLLSGLELEADSTNDGLLEVHEILELQLDSDLVTLSACETGLGGGFFTEIPAGDDFVGLTRAFLQAGSSSVLATLWKVDDRSTVALMKDFYTHLEDAGVKGDKAVALAQAQRTLRASKEYGHPYYWAPFVLVGAAQVNTNASG